MGQITNPIVKGITVNPIDRQTGPGAGAGATGNMDILFGAGAGANSSANNLIVLGNGAGGAGIGNSTGVLDGTIILGVGSAPALVSSGFAGPALPLTLMGAGDLLLASRVSSTLVAGAGIANGTSAIDQSVLLGNALYQNVLTNAGGPVGFRQAVIIGQGIMTASAATSISTTNLSVIVGSAIFTASAPTVNNSVIIGQAIEGGGTTGSNLSGCVIIGNAITLASNAPNGNVLIGSSVTFNGVPTANPITNNVVIGISTTYDGVSNVIIGNDAAVPTTAASNAAFGNVCIGFKAGTSVTPGTSINNLLILESALNAGAAASTLLYGSFASGNLILGNSTQAANRDFGGVAGTNMLKLLNGTKATGANIIGGGYFYVAAGVLHWVDSNGVDFGLSDPTAPTTGASTATFVATNKPGATTGAGPVAWENKVIQGVSYQSPLWAT
jgi:hypothetical protein